MDGLKNEISSDKGKQIYDNVLKTKNALDLLFNGLLDISRLDAGVIEPNNKAFNIKSVLASIEGEFQELANEKQLGLKVYTTSATIYSDQILIERILALHRLCE